MTTTIEKQVVERLEIPLTLLGDKTVHIDIWHIIHSTKNKDEVSWRNLSEGDPWHYNDQHYLKFYQTLSKMCIKNNVHSIEYFNKDAITLQDLKTMYKGSTSLSQLLRLYLSLNHKTV